jgi:Cupin domain
MYHQTLIGRSLQATLHYSLLFLLGLVGSFAHAQAPAQEQALTQTADDAQLKWGPCPPFLPKGCGIAVLHGDPAKDNVDVFFKVPAQSTIPLHWHTSPERMVLVAGELHVTYDGQKTAVLKAGTYAYGPAKRPHKGFCASAVPCVLFIAFESPLDAVPLNLAGRARFAPEDSLLDHNAANTFNQATPARCGDGHAPGAWLPRSGHSVPARSHVYSEGFFLPSFQGQRGLRAPGYRPVYAACACGPRRLPRGQAPSPAQARAPVLRIDSAELSQGGLPGLLVGRARTGTIRRERGVSAQGRGLFFRNCQADRRLPGGGSRERRHPGQVQYTSHGKFAGGLLGRRSASQPAAGECRATDHDARLLLPVGSHSLTCFLTGTSDRHRPQSRDSHRGHGRPPLICSTTWPWRATTSLTAR